MAPMPEVKSRLFRFEIGDEIKNFPVSQVAAITFGGSLW